MANVRETEVTVEVDSEGEAKSPQPKYLQIAESLRKSIESGRYRNGIRLPSEAELVRRFSVSRMTAVKAMQHLQQEGLLIRRTGSGSYAAENTQGQKPVFGLIIPDLGETEIFEPICKGMSASPNAGGHSLSWGHSTGTELEQGGRSRAPLPAIHRATRLRRLLCAAGVRGAATTSQSAAS